MDGIVEYLHGLKETLSPYPWAYSAIVACALIVLAWIVNWITKRILLHGVGRLMQALPSGESEENPVRLSVISHLANIVPALVLAGGAAMIPGIRETLVIIIRNVCSAFIVLSVALALAKKEDADLVLATDPDADRLGVYVKDTATGEYRVLTGNMSGCLLADYEIGQWKEQKGLPEDGALVTTIVSSNMAQAIGRKYGIDVYETLTGFKYIGEQIKRFEDQGRGTYLFGFEESYGCLIGTHARDKDAIVATMALCEAAAYYKSLNMTLWDAMVALYEELGYFKDGIISFTMKGIDGLEKIQKIMNTLREEAPTEIGAHKVLAVRDYKTDTRRVLATGETMPSGLPQSNVLYYELDDEAWCCVRPSGTEPKIKIYFGVKGSSFADADEKSQKIGEALKEMIEQI